MSSSNKDEKVLGIAAKVFIIIAGLLFLYNGVLHKPTPSEGTLWDALHPSSVLNIVGVILFFVFMVVISGTFSKRINDRVEDAGAKFIVPLLIAGVGGILLMFA